MTEFLPQYVKSALECLYLNGFEGYLVGGCVRDWIMGKKPHDFDITTNALPDQIKNCFSDYRTVDIGMKHGTVSVVFGTEQVEITTYRLDGTYSDNRRPDSVSFTPNLIDDLKRRDFNMNAIAWSPSALVDPFGGIDDIKNGRIACVGEPDRRFKEDALRMLRALRFSAVLGFEIDVETAKSIHRNSHLLAAVSAERKFTELSRLVGGCNAQRVLADFSDIIITVIPQIGGPTDEYFERCQKLGRMPDDVQIRLAVLLSDAGSDAAYDALQALHADGNTLKTVCAIISEQNTEITDYISAKHLIHRLGYSLAKKAALFKENAELIGFIKRAHDERACTSLKELAVSGYDLLNLGIQNGKDVGDMLNALLNAVIDERTENSRSALIEIAKNSIDSLI